MSKKLSESEIQSQAQMFLLELTSGKKTYADSSKLDPTVLSRVVMMLSRITSQTKTDPEIIRESKDKLIVSLSVEDKNINQIRKDKGVIVGKPKSVVSSYTTYCSAQTRENFRINSGTSKIVPAKPVIDTRQKIDRDTKAEEQPDLLI